jgi:hypothetical protein
MHPSFTSPLRFLSSTSLLVLLGGCPSDGDSCGVEGAPASGLTAATTDVNLTYGNLSSLSGNDCPAADAPSGVVSLSIEGTQTDGTGLITFCIPRPDLLADGRALGTTQSMGEIRVIDFSGTANNCTFAHNSAMPPTGTATATGICDNGTNAAGFALTFDGTVNVRRTCGADVTNLTLQLTGKVAITSRD